MNKLLMFCSILITISTYPILSPSLIRLPNTINWVTLDVLRQTSSLNFSPEMPFENNRTGLTWQNVLNQEGGSCGYHALFNILILLSDKKTQENEISDETKADLINPVFYQFFMANMAPIIAQHRGSNTISWLDGNELEILLQETQERSKIVVLEHIQSENFDFTQDHLLKIKDFLIQDNATLGFIWNSGLRTQLNEMGGIHWVGFVATKNMNNITLYELNSSPGIKPGFEHIDQLFKSTPQQIQNRIKSALTRHMQEGIQNLQFKLELFRKKNDSNIFTHFIDCRTNNQGRDIGIWENITTKNRIEYNSGASCERMKNNYPGSWFININNEESIFYPNEMLESLFRVCLISWKDYASWPAKIQNDITELLQQYLNIAIMHNPIQQLNMIQNIIIADRRLNLKSALNMTLRKLPTTFSKKSEIIALGKRLENAAAQELQAQELRAQELHAQQIRAQELEQKALQEQEQQKKITHALELCREIRIQMNFKISNALELAYAIQHQ